MEVNYKKKYGELDKRARKQATLGIFLIVITIFDEGYENKILYTIVLIALLVYIVIPIYRTRKETNAIIHSSRLGISRGIGSLNSG